MRLSGESLLAAWETGRRHRGVRRMVPLLSLASGVAAERLWSISLGVCNHRLLELFAANFGPLLEAVSACPQCGELVEFSLPIAEILADGRPSDTAVASELELEGEFEGEFARLRVLTVADLEAAATASSDAQAHAELLRRCVVMAERAGQACQPEQLSRSFQVAIAEQLGELDPHAELLLELCCPECEASWQVDVDVTEHVCTAVDRSARWLLLEISALARIYHWSEAEILAMQPERRRIYLELAGE